MQPEHFSPAAERNKQPIVEVLGSLLFCGNDNLVRDVLCGGRWQVRGGRHVAQDAIASAYKCAVARLRSL